MQLLYYRILYYRYCITVYCITVYRITVYCITVYCITYTVLPYTVETQNSFRSFNIFYWDCLLPNEIENTADYFFEQTSALNLTPQPMTFSV